MSFIPTDFTQPRGTTLYFDVTPAHGGYIVRIGNRLGNEEPVLHVIPETDDLGHEIGKIITLYYLTKPNDKNS